mmetsp:Transcript_78435/g.168095  ORF Transcript_78435/g.168095 Transcript_78435/m.168095 type:complete len:181 (+) Transcript_78435:3-545(+)
MIVFAAMDRIICFRDPEIEERWLAENSADPRAMKLPALRAPGVDAETGPLPHRGPLSLDTGGPCAGFKTVGSELAKAAKKATAKADKSRPKGGGSEEVDPTAGAGTIWEVVGGGEKGGIVVRLGEGLKTAELGRLSTGAHIREMELIGDRLHYEKVEGDGPDFGWVSLTFKGSPLVVKVE